MSASAGGAAASGLLSLAANKILAVQLGPSAVAALQTLQQVRQTAAIAATANGQTAIVQGLSALSGADRARYLRTSAAFFAAATLAVVALLWFTPDRALERVGFARIGAPVFWLTITVVLTSVYLFSSALLNALQRIEVLAMLQIAGPLAMAALAWPATRLHWDRALAALVTASAAAAASAALVAILRFRAKLKDWVIPTSWIDWNSAKRFCSISGAMLLTGLAASTVTMLVRGSIVRSQGLAETGLFDAAWSISMNQVTLVLASVQTYYLPALARTESSAGRAHEISRVLIASVAVSAPVIALLAVFKPLTLHLLYSAAFTDAQGYLRWTLLGDYFKVTSWILSVPMLAAADMSYFVASDLAVVGVFAGASQILLGWLRPAESAAAAFLAMYVTHLILSWAYLGLRQGIRIPREALLVWAGGLVLVLSASWVSWQGWML
jgi:O-antigen/teichoic acid export membrane protein